MITSKKRKRGAGALINIIENKENRHGGTEGDYAVEGEGENERLTEKEVIAKPLGTRAAPPANP